MELECTCMNINKDRWDELMKGKKRISYKWLVNKIKKMSLKYRTPQI